MAISNIEFLSRAGLIFRSNVEEKNQKAFVMFSKVSKGVRDNVFGKLYDMVTLTRDYWRSGEDAFYDRNGLSSTPEQKAQAIEAQMTQMVAALEFRGEANLREVFYCLNAVSSLQKREKGMALFNLLPKTVREKVYKELVWILPVGTLQLAEEAFHDRGLTSTPNERRWAIHSCLLRSVRELLLESNQHDFALELFKGISSELREGVYFAFGELKITKTAQGLTSELFYDKTFSMSDKAIAIANYLEHLQKNFHEKILDYTQRRFEKLPVTAEVKETADLLKLTETAPDMLDEEIEADALAVVNMFDRDAQPVTHKAVVQGLSNFREKEQVTILREPYDLLTPAIQDFSCRNLVSYVEAPGRELLYVDPFNSPALNDHYDKFRKTLILMSNEQILSRLKAYVRDEIFKDKSPQVESVRAFVVKVASDPTRTVTHKGHADWKVPMISIDEFVKLGIGLDYHQALVTLYFLDKLIKEASPLLKGTVQFMRSNVKSGGSHNWAVFIPQRITSHFQNLREFKQHLIAKGERWHLDTFWDVLENFADPKGRGELRKRYGAPAIEQEDLSTRAATEKRGQPVT